MRQVWGAAIDDMLNPLFGVVAAVNAGVAAATTREGYRMADESAPTIGGDIGSPSPAAPTSVIEEER